MNDDRDLHPSGPDTPPARRPADRLAGREVSLRPLDPDADAGPLFACSHGDTATEALWDYMPYGPFPDEQRMRHWLDDCARSDDPAFRVVIDPAGRPRGMVSFLNIVPAHRRLELGHIWYAPGVQRTKTNTEVIYLMLCDSFDRLGCRRVEWKCNALNTRSRRAALRLGFRFEGIFRQHMILKECNRDTAWFAIVDADWPAVKSNMERWLYGNENGLSLTELNAPLVEGFHDPVMGTANGRE